MKTKAITLALLAALAVVVVALAAVAYVDSGGKYSSCGLVASVTESEAEANELPPALTKRYPQILDAISRASASQNGQSVMPCDERDALIAELEMMGWRPVDSGNPNEYKVAYDGRAYLIEAYLAVA